MQLREKQQLSLLQKIDFLFARPLQKARTQSPHSGGTAGFDVYYYLVGTESVVAGAAEPDELLTALDIREIVADTPDLPALPPLW